ncbi:unnamed protein product [Linum trigynum]|uniref:Uncharacterized protein n=1 Tax=Linum trigynum TaxID=586398 RepID=A0AAV2DWE0_9ROSI
MIGEPLVLVPVSSGSVPIALPVVLVPIVLPVLLVPVETISSDIKMVAAGEDSGGARGEGSGEAVGSDDEFVGRPKNDGGPEIGKAERDGPPKIDVTRITQ